MSDHTRPTTMEIIETNRGRPCMLLDGFCYRLHRKRDGYNRWLCVNEKKESKCHGKLKVYANGQVFLTQAHRCLPNVAVTEIRKKMYVCKKRAREEITVPVSQIFKEEFQDVLTKGYDKIAGMPIYDNVKSSLCKVRREALDALTSTEKSGSEERRPLPEIVEYKLEQPTVLEKIELTQSILDKSKTAKGVAAVAARAPVNTATNRYHGSGRPLEKRSRQEVAEEEQDDDRMFMLSLAGKMKHLSPADNMKFRLEVQQLLLNKLCPDVTDNASYTSVLIKEEIEEEPLTDENVPSTGELEPPAVKIKEEVVDENNGTDMDYN